MMKVRFAPSPTGYFHVGGARTAFYNWMMARKAGGKFVLRIEDTDAERNREEWVDGILDALSWLGVTWDEGPFRQSERMGLYAQAASKLYASGAAYYCDCTREEIDARVKASGGKAGYDRYCRDRGLGPESGGALRFRVPLPGATTFVDLVRGEVTVDHGNIEDFVLIKGNGAPLFVLANVVDDIDMGITHVVRAEEHLPNTPKSILVFRALGAELPSFGHVPVLVNEKRQKLSKRRDRVAVEDYRNMGYLAPAMINYLALLGWSPKDGREFMTIEEMTAAFDIGAVGHSPSFFDDKKMAHFNGVYIRALSDEDFVAASLPFLGRNDWWTGEAEQMAAYLRLAPLVKERVAVLSEVSVLVRPVFERELSLVEADVEKEIASNPAGVQTLSEVRKLLEEVEVFEPTLLEAVVRGYAEEHGMALRKIQAPLRVATTGSRVGLPLFETWAEIGREGVLARLAHFC
ncbi:MAG: glutamate--tRNA ligase [Nitrospiraceae bacterium]|nr:glutamate--tRNA ligase [Nitrospiraceae bacterium]